MTERADRSPCRPAQRFHAGSFRSLLRLLHGQPWASVTVQRYLVGSQQAQGSFQNLFSTRAGNRAAAYTGITRGELRPGLLGGEGRGPGAVSHPTHLTPGRDPACGSLHKTFSCSPKSKHRPHAAWGGGGEGKGIARLSATRRRKKFLPSGSGGQSGGQPVSRAPLGGKRFKPS